MAMLRERVLRSFESRAAPWYLAALALLLSLPGLGLGLQADDHILGFQSRFGEHPLMLFGATPAELARLREFGSLAWWSNPQLELAFLRPLSSLSHVIEFRLWPNAAWAMHLSNAVLYALLVLVAALLYRELLPNRVLAGMAATLFAIDDAHSPAVGWISSRNTVLAGLFTLLAVLFHVRAHRGARLAYNAISALCVVLALLAGEAGVAALAYLAAYALVFEAGPWWSRLRSILPQFAVFAVYVAIYFTHGYGLRGSSWYHEPNAPLVALREGIADLPLWLVSLFGPSWVGLSSAVPQLSARMIALALALPVLLGLWWLLPRTQLNRFFAFALVFCSPALFATVPQERVTLAATFAVFGWIVSLLAATKTAPQRLARVYRSATIAVHCVLAPLLFVPGLNLAGTVERGTQALLRAVPNPRPAQIVLVNSPFELLSMYAGAIMGGSTPLHQLYAGASNVSVERTAEDALELRVTPGWGSNTIERVFCSLRALPRTGTERAVRGMSVAVIETDRNGRPSLVRFRFPTPLESPDRLWLLWQGTAPVPWHPPSLSHRVTLPSTSLFTSMAR